MDAVQTITGGETPAGAGVGAADTQDPGVVAQSQVSTSEMRELPVEDWDYQRPRRGEVRDGVILAIREQEIIVDVGAKRDGVVPFADIQRLGAEAVAALSVGDRVPVYVLRPEDQDGNLLVSLHLAQQAQAWVRAQELADSGEVWEEQVIGYNKGGVVVPVGEIRGFVPASQIPGFPLGMSPEERITRLSTLVGETLQVKVIEINRRKRRLILSSTAAQKQWRDEQREKLLADLREGEVRKGTVSSLCSFGAFVDLGGADGLIHLSELSWRRIRHPKEVVRVGEQVEVYVLRLDREKMRIGLSLKRLQPEPWALVEDRYELGQLVEGTITNVIDFGAFAEVEDGVEGLIHVSELTDAPISHPREVVKKGDLLLLRIIRIDTRRKRLGLSLKRVLESEWAEWAARVAKTAPQRPAKAEKAEPFGEEEPEQPVSLTAEEGSAPVMALMEAAEAEPFGEEEPEQPAPPSAEEGSAPVIALMEAAEGEEEPEQPASLTAEEGSAPVMVLMEAAEGDEEASDTSDTGIQETEDAETAGEAKASSVQDPEPALVEG